VSAATLRNAIIASLICWGFILYAFSEFLR